MSALLINTTFSLLEKKVIPTAPRKSRGKVRILISYCNPIEPRNASGIVVPILDPNITAKAPVKDRIPVPTKAKTSTEIKLLLCTITVETNPVSNEEAGAAVYFLINCLNPLLEKTETACSK